MKIWFIRNKPDFFKTKKRQDSPSAALSLFSFLIPPLIKTSLIYKKTDRPKYRRFAEALEIGYFCFSV